MRLKKRTADCLDHAGRRLNTRENFYRRLALSGKRSGPSLQGREKENNWVNEDI